MVPTTIPILLTLLWPAPPASAPVPATPLLQDEDEEVVDKRPEIKELLDTLKGHVKERGAEDTEAIAVIDTLTQEYPRCGPKDRKEVVKQLAATFKAKRTKPLESGEPDDRLYYASATALGRMGPESVKPLEKLLGEKSLKKQPRVLRRLALSLGDTRHADAIDPLLDLLKHPEAPLQAAGAEALGNFDEMPQKTRKEVFEELLKILMGQKARKDLDPTDLEAADRWNTISGPIVASLQRLTGHDERDPAAWQSWWNDNKKSDWDARN